MAWQPNPGHCPPEADGTAEGKDFRVHVRLRCGYDTRRKEPAGWPATGRGACRWTLTGHRCDIVEWELIG